YSLLPKIISVLTLTSNNDVDNQFKSEFVKLLNDYNPFVYSFHQQDKYEDRQNFFFNENSFLDRKNEQMLVSRSVVDFCNRMKWSTVNLVYSNEFNKNYFIFEANRNNICVDKTFQVTINDIAKSG